MKGGLVVVGFAFRALAQTLGLEAIAPLRVVVVADEEVGSPEGQQVIAASVSGARAALVFEAGRKGDAIITSRKGTGGMTAVAAGKAAHAGANHQDGVNAIWALASFIDRIQGLTDYARGVTLNVGKVSGGQGKNTVPDQAEAAFDLRFVSTRDGEATVEAIARAAREAEAHVPGSSIALSGGIARKPLERSPENVALLELYASCAKECGLGFGEAGLIGGGSDASTTSTLGIASIDGLGPRGIGFHTKDEQIELSSLVPKAQALARAIVKLSLP
jgi:glutamate carboxypeptidase